MVEPKVCAWCRNPLKVNQKRSNDNLLVNTCLQCLRKMDIHPHEILENAKKINSSLKKDTWIDEYPYGTIVLDYDDVVLRYNNTEAELANLNPKDVEGKHFFSDIAPCTAVKEFQGRLQDLKKRDSDGQETIKFTFNHKNFFAYVSIVITYLSEPAISVLSVKKIEE